MQILEVDDQIRLEPLTEAHAERILHVVDQNRAYLRKWLPWLDKNTCLEHFSAFCRQAHTRNAGGEGLVQAILYDNVLSGVSGYNFIDDNNRWGEIGYWLAEPMQGKGIISRTVATQLEYGFNQLNLHRVSICAAVENRASRAIPERLGFTFEGTLRQSEWLYDHYVDQAVYAKLASDP